MERSKYGDFNYPGNTGLRGCIYHGNRPVQLLRVSVPANRYLPDHRSNPW